MSILIGVSNFLEKLYSQTIQGLDVQIAFKEENVTFTHRKAQEALGSVFGDHEVGPIIAVL